MSESYKLLIAAANRLAKSYAKKFLETAFVPIDYTRTKEIPAILDISGILNMRSTRLRILDIGSPQILSLSLCLYSPLWDITYINPYEMELKDLHLKSSTLSLNNLGILNGDITDLSTIPSAGQFDYIFSCSVFEHIHPENEGDSVASRNVARLLKPSGIFSLSVPFYKRGFSEYKDGDVYGRKGIPGEETFFQRFYDEQSLDRRIIKPSELTVLAAKYIGEKHYFVNNIHKRMASLIDVGRRRLLFGRIFRNISDIFMEESRDHASLKKPYLAIIALKKDV